MKDQFILLTLQNSSRIIVGTSHILYIEPYQEGTGSRLQMNEGSQSIIVVEDSFEDICQRLGLISRNPDKESEEWN